MPELRIAIRTLLRAPGFALLACVSLAIGIGANAAIYTVFDAVVLRPFTHVHTPSALVLVVSDSMSHPEYEDVRAGSRAFERVAAFATREVALGGDPLALGRAALVTGSYFDVLGTSAAAGRALADHDDLPTSDAAVAVITHELARARYGTIQSAVGQTLVVNDSPFRIVGVAPPGFRGVTLAATPDLWMPVHAWPLIATGSQQRLQLERRGWGWLTLVGRLRPATTLEQAETEVNRSSGRDLRSADLPRLVLASATTAAGGLHRKEPRMFLALLAGIVGAGLLMACANVANLMMVRVTGRRRELAIRQALGASRGRIRRLLVFESLVVSLVAGAAALLLTAWCVELFKSFMLPGGIPLAQLEFRFDFRLAAVAIGLAALAGLLLGLIPSWQSSRTDVLTALRDVPTPFGTRDLGRRALVGAQVAVCLVLLAGSSLFIRSVRATLGSDVGFAVNQVASAAVSPELQRFDAPRTLRLLEAIRSRLAQDPRVTSATWAMLLPLSGERMRESVQIEGRERLRTDERFIRVNAVGPAYFSTMSIPVLRGREFDERDRPGAPSVVVINETMARRYWHDGNPLGARLQLLNTGFHVVGVAADSTYEALGLGPTPFVYLAAAQAPDASTASVLVRTAGNSAAMVPLLRETIASVAPALPIAAAGTLRDQFGSLLMPQRFAATLLSAFAVAALALAAVGMYGVTAYAVVRRTREIGIRVALGAARADVLRLVLRGTVGPVAVGAAAGLASAMSLAKLLAGFLPGVSPLDPIAFAATTAIAVVLAVAASITPTRRALALDPVQALRNE